MLVASSSGFFSPELLRYVTCNSFNCFISFATCTLIEPTSDLSLLTAASRCLLAFLGFPAGFGMARFGLTLLDCFLMGLERGRIGIVLGGD